MSNSLIPAPADPLVFSGLPLHLLNDDGQLWLSNDQLAPCLGTSIYGAQKLSQRFRDRLSEAETRIIEVDLKAMMVDTTSTIIGPNDPAESQKVSMMSDTMSLIIDQKRRAKHRRKLRIWSFPEGCLKAAVFSGTEQAKNFTLFIVDYKDRAAERGRQTAERDVLWHAEHIRQTERHFFGKYPHWETIRERLLIYSWEPARIAEHLGRSVSSVRRAIHRMIQVGLLHPRLIMAAIGGSAFGRSLKRSGVVNAWGHRMEQLDLFGRA